MQKYSKGFSLIEIMVVVAIIGILAGVAYPSYLNSVRKTNRSDAKVELNNIVQRLQRCFTAYSVYNDADCGVYKQLSEGDAKIISREGYYAITISNVSATGYTLTATPTAGSPQVGDKCGAMTMTNTGARGAAGGTVEQCW